MQLNKLLILPNRYKYRVPTIVDEYSLYVQNCKTQSLKGNFNIDSEQESKTEQYRGRNDVSNNRKLRTKLPNKNAKIVFEFL